MSEALRPRPGTPPREPSVVPELEAPPLACCSVRNSGKRGVCPYCHGASSIGWRSPILVEAYRADAPLDAHRFDPDLATRPLVGEAVEASGGKMAQ